MNDTKKLKKIEFKVSAPGRITLYGEPLAMYGKHVVTASIDLRTTLNFCEITDDRSDIIKIDFPDIDLWLNLSLSQVLNFFFKDSENIDLFVEKNVLLLRCVQCFITLNGLWSTYEQRFSLQTFFFLFIFTICTERLNVKSFHVYLTSQLPMRAGLGSSTSFTVCLAAGFIYWARMQKGIDAFNDYDLATIAVHSMYCEEIIQNYVVNIDNDVCCYGQIIKFRYNNRNQDMFKDISLLNVPEMKILLIDSTIRQNKFEQMNRLATIKSSYPTSLNIILNNIDYISENACDKLKDIDYIQRSNFSTKQSQLQNVYKILSFFIQLHQTYLYHLELSHPFIDIICTIATEYGFAGKLTSFGGKYAYILLPPDAIDEDVTRLSAHLISMGFAVTKTSMSCNGVRIDDSY